MRRQGKDFSRTMTSLFATMLIQPQADVGEDETVHEEREDSVERAATTATSLDAEQGSGNINRTQSTAIPNDPFPQGIGSCGSPRRQDTILGDRPAQTRFKRLSKQSNDPHLSRVNTLGSGEDSMKLQELMNLYIKLSERVLALENIKIAQDLEITNLKKRVKKLEKKKKSRTPQLKRSTAEVTTVSVPSDVDVSAASLIRPVDDSITDDITLAETLMKIKSSTLRSQKDKGVIFKEPSKPTTTSRPQSHIPAKDKGKGIMQELEKPLKVKGKDQIEYDANVAQRLQTELDEEARIEREEEASKAANIAEWDDVQAMMDADY
ncbi:hypothetical protein Tco_1512555, partial [Tanacetum coccineum]